MCDIHSATVSCCELPVCMLCAAVSCLSACCVLLCDAVSCSHHCRRAVVITVIMLQSSLLSCCSHHCLHSYPRLLSPQTPFQMSDSQCISPCMCLYIPLRVEKAARHSKERKSGAALG